MKDKILNYLEQAVLNQGYFPIKVTVSQNNNKINVFLDGDNGVNVDECGKTSKKLQEYLDEDPQVPKNYVLNVASAGIDEPLINLRQFKKSIQRNLKVRTDNNKEELGKLIYVDPNEIILETKKRNIAHFDFDHLEEAKVVIANI